MHTNIQTQYKVGLGTIIGKQMSTDVQDFQLYCTMTTYMYSCDVFAFETTAMYCQQVQYWSILIS